MKQRYTFLIFSTLFFVETTYAEFNVHKYFAPIWTFETRAERKGMLTADAWQLHGTTTKSKDTSGKTTGLLNLYGPQKMHQIGRANGANAIVDTPAQVLAQLWNTIPISDNYAQIEFDGRLSFTGGSLAIAVNITDKAFIGVNIPHYKLDVTNITWKDITPEAEQDAAWIQFKTHFDEILRLNNISLAPTSVKQIGDMLVYAGWTINSEDQDQLDFVDFGLRMGFLLGNDIRADVNQAFSFPGGYDGHKGILADASLGLGMHSKISLSLYAKAIVLLNSTQTTRMQTAAGQNGFIKLAKGEANYNPGNIYSVGGALKFDAFDQLSLFFGYLYNHRQDDKLTAKDSILFPPEIINSDANMHGWSMHTISSGLELDFTNYERKIHPRATFGYNYIVKGTNIFLNNTVGGGFALALTADF